ncbi:MAG: alpha/beta hydrolase [Bacteroidales bacterium]|nr:alpha/beta hydrolase [Bacteroidales bacterium]
MSIFKNLFGGKRVFPVRGEQGGISCKVTLPVGFNPETDHCPMAILMHGFMAKKEMQPIAGLAVALAEEGIASISFDFNAHGHSEGLFQNMTISNEISDAKAVFDYACSLPYVTEIAFVGHSQGGVVAGMLAGKLEAAAGEASAEAAGLRKPACLVQLAPAAVLKDDAIAGQCMGTRYDAKNPPEWVNVFFHKLGRKFILEAQKLPIYETSGQYSGKVCLIHGTSDKIVPVSYSRKYADTYAHADLHLIEGEGHFFNKKKRAARDLTVRFLKENLG